MASIPVYSHVVLVMMENHGYTQIIGATGGAPNGAPYINSLLPTSVLFTNSHGVGHPSFPNYLALYSGSTQGTTNDQCPPPGSPYSAANLASVLIAAGKSFAGYAENKPALLTTCAGAGSYAGHHVPWPWFSNPPAAGIFRDFSTWPSNAAGWAALPTVSFVVPNLLDDMHDGSITQGDTWLQTHMDPYLQWAKTNNSLLIIQWDEDNFTTADHIPTIFCGANLVPGQYAESGAVGAVTGQSGISHYNILRTIEDMYGTTRTANAAVATPITDIWSGTTPPPALAIDPTPIPAGAVNVFYTTTLNASGGTRPYTWTAAGPPTGNAKPHMATGADINSMFAADPATTRVFFNRPDSFAICHSPTASELTAPLACTLILNYKSYAQFASDIAANVITFPYQWVMYDNEVWSFTPVGEQNDPFTFMANFITLAHAHGFKVMCTPARDLATAPAPVQPRIGGESDDTWYNRVNIAGSAAGSGADIVEIQDQANTLNLTEFDAFFNLAKEKALVAKPGIPVWCGVSVNYGTAAQMAQAAKSVAGDGYWLNSLGNITQSIQYLLQMVPASGGGSSGLPSGITLNASTGVLSGTTASSGTFGFTAQVADVSIPVQHATQPFTLVIASGPPPPPGLQIVTSLLPPASVSVAYNASLTGQGGTAPYHWNATNLPSGLGVNTGSGLISGIPNAQGNFNVSITLTDAEPVSVMKVLVLQVGTGPPPPPPPPAISRIPMGAGILTTNAPVNVIGRTIQGVFGSIAAADVLPQDVIP